MTIYFLFVNAQLILSLFLIPCLFAIDSKKVVCEGVEYTHLQTLDHVVSSLHLVTIDPTQVSLELIKAENMCIGLNQTTKLAQQASAVVAINGGFCSSQGIPAGIMKIENTWFADSDHQRAALGWKKDGTYLIDHLKSTWDLMIGELHYPVDRLNQLNNSDQTILYSPAYAKLVEIDKKDVAITIVNNTVIHIKQGIERATIPRSGYVYVVGHQSKINHFLIKIGMKVNVSNSLTSHGKAAPEWYAMDYIIGGTPLLVKGGKKIINFSSEKIQQSFIDQHHCRTAAGILPNGKWLWVVIDGRDNHNGRGVTLYELADIMAELGCTDAINLCGGKSSTLVIQGVAVSKAFSFGFHEFANFEFLAGEKLVSDALIAIANNPRKKEDPLTFKLNTEHYKNDTKKRRHKTSL
jgi:hypothetical protein